MGEFAAMNDAIHVMNTDMNETMHRIEGGCFPGICRFYHLAEGSQTLAEGSTDQAGAVEETPFGILCQYHRRGEHTHESAQASLRIICKICTGSR